MKTQISYNSKTVKAMSTMYGDRDISNSSKGKKFN